MAKVVMSENEEQYLTDEVIVVKRIKKPKVAEGTRRGCGIWISYRRYGESHFQDAIQCIFDEYDRYKASALALRESLPAAQGAERAADRIMSL